MHLWTKQGAQKNLLKYGSAINLILTNTILYMYIALM